MTNSQEEQTAQLKKEVDLLTQQLALLKVQMTVDTQRQTQDALVVKAALDALKEQAASQSALDIAQAQLPFAELQGIKAGISGLTMPSGKEGTVKVSAGTTGTALLRSKRPMLELLKTVVLDFVKICPSGAALLTEAQLGQAYAATFALKRISDETNALAQATNNASTGIPDGGSPPMPGLPLIAAGAYSLGFTLDTINSLAKLFRTDRQLDVFSADVEAVQMLGYLLEACKKGFVANPARLDDKAITEAERLQADLRNLGTQVQVANDTLAKIKKFSEDIAKAAENDPIKAIKMPTDEQISLLKAEIDAATSLLDSLHPAKKPDAFWAQVTGQLLAKNIHGKQRLLIEAKAQTVQVTEAKWYRGERILATGEVQVAYRVLNADGSLAESGVILKASKADDARIDKLDVLTWSE